MHICTSQERAEYKTDTAQTRNSTIDIYVYIYVYIYICIWICTCMCIQSYIHLYLYICIYVQMYICTCVSVHQVHYRNARNARRVQQTRNSTKDIHICIHVNHRNARNARRIQRRRAIQLYIYIYIYVFMYITGTRGMQVDTTDAQFDYTYKHVCIYVHHRNSRHARRLQHRRAIQRPNGRVVFPYKRRQSGPLLLCLVLCSCSVFLQCVLAVSS